MKTRARIRVENELRAKYALAENLKKMGGDDSIWFQIMQAWDTSLYIVLSFICSNTYFIFFAFSFCFNASYIY